MIPHQHIADAFNLGGRVVDVQPLGHGLINDTYLVTTDGSQVRHAVLQRINRRAFPQPELILDNLRALIAHVHTRKQTNGSTLRIPEIFSARDGKDFVLDQEGGFWRALGYIENTNTFVTISTLRQAEEAGAALGRFHALVSDLAPERLHATRPRFHKTPAYFERFTEVATQIGGRSGDADLKWCVAFIDARRQMVSVLEDARQRGELALRVIHGDPKIDNFLFDPERGHVVSMIDLDTVQPGLVHYDVGDGIRSGANPAGESPADLKDVRFDLDVCHGFLTRYLNETRSFLTRKDYEYFYDAIRLIPFELGLRFLTDHLENDSYFKTEWRGQNLHRAMVQFRLTADVEKNADKIRALIAG